MSIIQGNFTEKIIKSLSLGQTKLSVIIIQMSVNRGFTDVIDVQVKKKNPPVNLAKIYLVCRFQGLDFSSTSTR